MLEIINTLKAKATTPGCRLIIYMWLIIRVIYTLTMTMINFFMCIKAKSESLRMGLAFDARLNAIPGQVKP
jgi:hypothetical protein